jgi:hypothetical protein
MDTYEMEINVTLPDTPKALGDWANYEINNVVSTVEFIQQLQGELDKTDLKVENVEFKKDEYRIDPFIIFKLPKNLELLFYKDNEAAFNGNVITIRLKEMIKLNEDTYQRWLYETNVKCPYIDPWKHLQYQGMATPVPSKYKHDVDILIAAINKVIKDHSVKKIDM